MAAATTRAGAEPVAGPAFSPTTVDATLMAPGWAARPVRHAGAHAAADLVVTLDQQIYPAVAPAPAALARERGGASMWSGEPAGSPAGREVEIAGYCCPPGPDDRLPGVRYRTLGIAAIALIVHPDNPVRDLSLADARGLFGGRLRRWSEVKGGGPFAQPVVPVVRLHCKHRPGHWRLILDNEDLFSARAVEVGAIEDMVAQVAKRRGAVGYETAWMARRHGRVRMVRLDGVDPLDRAALAAGRYPLYRTFTLATFDGAETPLVRAAVAEMERAFAATAKPFSAVPAATLAHHGWRFTDGELHGAPVP